MFDQTMEARVEVGERLRQAREARGLTLQEAAGEVRVVVPYLEALESGDEARLPSAVQARGFLRLYADFLGLSTEEMVADWEGRPLESAPASAEDEGTASIAGDAPGGATAELVEAENEEAISAFPLGEVTGEGSAGQAEDQAPEAATGPQGEVEAPAADEGFPAGSGGAAVPQRYGQMLREIGQRLRAAREGLGLRLEDAEVGVGTRKVFLEALETGDTAVFPSPIQARGVLEDYAAWLNLDVDSILDRFAEALEVRRQELNQRQNAARGVLTAPEEEGSHRFRGLFPANVVFGVVFFLGVAALLVWGFTHFTGASAGGTDQVSSISESLLRTATPEVTGSVSPSLQAPLGAGDLGVHATSLPGQVSSGNNSAPATVPTASVVVTAANNAPLQVVVSASQRVWMKVVADGQQRFAGRVAPGGVYTYSGYRQIELSTGSAAGLQVTFNGQDLGTLGQEGQVVTLLFSPQGMVTATPLPTATPVPTAKVSPTPNATAGH